MLPSEQKEYEARQEWLDLNRPRSKYPKDCSLFGCDERSDGYFGKTVNGEKKFYCSADHMLGLKKEWR